MKKIISLLVLISALAVLLIGCGPAKTEKDNTVQTNTEKKQELKIALDATYKPMEYLENGQLTGFSVDLINALAKQMNMDPKISNVAWDDIFDSLYSNQSDIIISSVTINDERKNTMLFSEPYYTSSPVILTKKDKNINSAKDLSGKTVAVQVDTTAQSIITNNIAGVNLKSFTTGDEAMDAFTNGIADAVVIDAPVIYDYAKEKNNPDYLIVEDGSVFEKEEFGIAANMNNPDLISKINSALSTLKSNGEYNKIYDKYFKAN